MTTRLSEATVLLAGATGAIGSRLLPALRARGARVIGLTRRPERVDALLAQGALPLVCDVYDAPRLAACVQAARPQWIVHQLTDLPAGLAPARMREGLLANARLRSEGTANLVAAARAAGVTRLLAQSIAWMYAPASGPRTEDDSLDLQAEGDRGVSLRGVAALEAAVLRTPGITGTVLRYGQFYGPGTGQADATGKRLPLHVDDAVAATVLALERDATGIFNVAEPSDAVSSERARRELGWQPVSRAAVPRSPR